MVADIETPESCAVDWRKVPMWKVYACGYGCNESGGFDEWWIMSPGAVLLHELLHFPGLLGDIPDCCTETPNSFNDIENLVGDFHGTSPVDRYGPYYAAMGGPPWTILYPTSDGKTANQALPSDQQR
jgi:hypothetical protein